MNHDEKNRREQLTKLYEEHFDFLVKYCMRQVGYAPELRGLAEDWSQEAFFVAIQRGDTFLNHPNPRAWLINTCRRKIYNHIRKGQRHGAKKVFSIDAYVEPSIEDRNERIERWMEKKEASTHIQEICALLTDNEFAVFMEHFENELTSKEVADKLQKTESAIKAAIRRIRKKSHRYFDSQ